MPPRTPSVTTSRNSVRAMSPGSEMSSSAGENLYLRKGGGGGPAAAG